MYQIVTIRLLDFYLVEDMGSRDAENEGLSLNLRFKWLPQGIFWLVDGVKCPHKVTHLLRTVFAPPCFFGGVRESWREGFLDLLTNVKCKE